MSRQFDKSPREDGAEAGGAEDSEFADIVARF